MATRQRTTRNTRKIPAAKQTRATPAPERTTAAIPVLVATDGSRAAAAAIRLATLMAERGTWAPEAMTVLEPIPVSVADMTLGVPSVEYSDAFTNSLVGAIQTHLRRYGGSAWKLAVEFGSAATSIVRRGKDAKAGLIVLGLGKHGKLTRLVGAETAARVVRHSDAPVLSVDSGVRELPRTAVVAIDFGDSSVRAAREALALLQAPGRLHLLHVRWAMNGKTLDDAGWERTYAMGVEQGFQRLARSLNAPPGIEITSELRLGGVTKSILEVAKKLGADLIAAGSHSQTVIDRLIIGSTPAQLLRAAKCSVLVAPPQPAGNR